MFLGVGVLYSKLSVKLLSCNASLYILIDSLNTSTFDEFFFLLPGYLNFNIFPELHKLKQMIKFLVELTTRSFYNATHHSVYYWVKKIVIMSLFVFHFSSLFSGENHY